MKIGIMYSGITGNNGADFVADFLFNSAMVDGHDVVRLGTMGGLQVQDIPCGLDLVIHSSGYSLTPELVDKFRKRSKLFVWTHNDEIPMWRERIGRITRLVNKHFAYTKEHPYGGHVEYLPLAADHTSYFKISGCAKRFDVSMIGCGHAWRRSFAERISKDFPNSRFDFTLSMRDGEINLLYNMTKVVLAPMQDCDQYSQGLVFGCPCRTFDVPAAGAFQLQAFRTGLKDIHSQEVLDETTLPSTQVIDDFYATWTEKVRKCLEDDKRREEIAAEMHGDILREHLYVHRLRKMLEFV